MKRATFKVRVWSDDGEQTTREITGYPVTIEGFEEGKFFVHRGMAQYCKYWAVSEASTGFSVMPPSWSGSHSNKTRAGAIAIVTERLKEKGRTAFLDALSRCAPINE